MSTFKIPPVYAETLFRMLDACTVLDSMKSYQVLSTHNWTFEGGTFGVREEPKVAGVEYVEETSNTELPTGRSVDIAKKMVRSAVARGADEDSPDFDPPLPAGFKEIMTNRQKARKTSRREAYAWSVIFAYSVADDRRIVTGMTAVYHMANLILNACHARVAMRGATQRHKRITALTKETVMGSSFAAEMSHTHTGENCETALRMMASFKVPELSVAEAQAKSVLAHMAARRITTDEDDFAEDLADIDDFMDLDLEEMLDDAEITGSPRLIAGMLVTIFPKCAVLQTPRRSYVLGMSDWRKVIIVVTGFRNYIAGLCADAAVGTVAQIAANSRTVSAVYIAFRDAVAAGALLETTEHLHMAKMYKGVLAHVKANIAGERAATHAETLLADVKASPVYAKCSKAVREYIGMCKGLDPKNALAAAKIFRLFPPPDVWMARALRNRWEKASAVHQADPADIPALEDALTEVILTARCYDKSVKLRLKDDYNRPSWWNAYVSGDYDAVPKADLAKHVVSTGIVELTKRSKYDPSVWKDSALGLDTFALAMLDDGDKNLKNMLSRMLYDKRCPMPDEVSAVFEELSAVMLKPESHKERIAYMNNLASRFKQSITEATVSAVMKPHPSFAPVKSGNERDLIFEGMSSPPPRVSDEPMTKRYSGDYWVTLFYSFDITGWSENMCANIQEASHRVWDKVCGTTAFSETSSNHHKAKVYMNNGGVKAWYRNGGANFEGYNGKEMTTLHIAIMTLAVRELRRKCPDVPSSMLKIVLQAYIDDGVCKMTLPSRISDRVFREWEDVVSNTWKKYGFSIEAKKSFPSYYYFEFLGEEFMAGRQLASGSKAAMRITAEPFDYWESLPERCMKIASACRGASSSGLPSLSAVIVQSYFTSMEVARWVRIQESSATAFWLLCPRILGGMGIPGIMQQSANASGAAGEEGMATIHAWASSGQNAAVEAAYDAVVRRGFAARTESEIFASPLGGTVSGPTMDTNPLAAEIQKGLAREAADGKLSELGKVLATVKDDESYVGFAEAVVHKKRGEVIQEVTLRDLQDGCLNPISAAFAKRFEKESTFLAFASRKKLRKKAKDGRDQAIDSHKVMVELIKPKVMRL